MILNTHPENRKEMVKAICEMTGMNATYLFTPTYAYQIGLITVSRDGSINCDDEAMIEATKVTDDIFFACPLHGKRIPGMPNL